MKQAILTSIFFLILTNIFGQTEKVAYKQVADKFEMQYNQNMYDSIFSTFSPAMQAGLPLEKTRTFFLGLQNQAGHILQRTFVKYVDSTYASYKTQFEKESFTVNISINKYGKINGLFVLPCKQSNIPIVERNKTIPFSDINKAFCSNGNQ